MGKGGEATCIVSTNLKVLDSVEEKVWKSSYNPLDPNAPKLPSKAQVKASIPKKCFERSALKSFYYVFRDSVWAAALVYATSLVVSTDVPPIFSLEMIKWIFVWTFYAFWMGTILTGHWVLGHECGHGAFSPNQTLNDIVGFIIHQALLVPYFAWQYSHAKHHRRTNHLTDGESHVPSTGIENGMNEHGERESLYAKLHEAIGDDAFAGVQVYTHLFIGWPLYLMGVASTGRNGADGKPLGDDMMDHFRPNSRLFPPKMRTKAYLSTAGMMFVLAIIVKLTWDYGFFPVLLWYWGPYTWTNAWLVLYTWLQHTDPSVPQYGDDEWTFVKGALTTIDRPYGIFDFFHHKIGSTHVAHHFFHEIPFYNGDEATLALKEYLGPLYNYDPTPWYKAMWRIGKTCHFVDGLEGIQFYRSFEDVPLTNSCKAKTS